ncbi:hypothetical protein ACP70R_044213 [Stipagrostis hirtigluma subsp. patula]
MMVKVEEPAPELPPAPGAEAGEDSPPLTPSDGDEEDEEETDSDGDGAGARGGAPPLKKGPWTPEEDKRLKDYVEAHGEGNWNQVQRNAGLNRCGKSCRLRWANHLRPDLKKGPFDDDEVEKVIKMHMSWGNKWAKMAACMPGRTDNEIKNFWNTRLKRHLRAGLPVYPEYLVSRSSNQDMNCHIPDESHGMKRSNGFSQENDIDIREIMRFDYLDYAKHMSLPGPNLVVPNPLSVNAMDPLKRCASTGCILSDYSGSLSCVQQLPDESKKIGCSTDFNYGMTGQLAPLGGAIASSHPVFDDNPSTSGTIQRSMKMELPSLQCPNHGCTDAWLYDCASGSPIEQAGAFESPGSMSLRSESFSPPNTGSGSLGAMVHIGDGLDNASMSQGFVEVLDPLSYNQISQSGAYPMRHPSSSVFGAFEIEGYPIGEIPAPSSSDSAFALNRYYQDTTMPDPSLEADFFNEGSPFSTDQSIVYTLNSNFGNDSCEARLPNEGHEHDSSAWKSMPGACHMSDFKRT